MCPASVRTSRASRALETGEAKLWVLLVGVNQYYEPHFPDLSCPALDCQGLGEAIALATQTFPQKAIQIHHDASVRHPQPLLAPPRLVQPPKLYAIYESLQQIAADAKPQDTVLFYFSGHGILDPESDQAVLCLTDTRKEALIETGLSVQALLTLLNQCKAHQQLVWLDACHSGSMTFRARQDKFKSKAQGKDIGTMPLPNPTAHLVELLRQHAVQSKGFYALLSCDQAQRSWEFPELGHGVFTYFLMRGLLGGAADEQGIIKVDALYRYVYYQTLRYIDKTNQQLRLINQQKRGRGETQLQPEYPLQTPKRIVEGVGEVILGLKPEVAPLQHPRQAFMIEGLGGNAVTLSMSKVLRSQGGFVLRYFPQPRTGWTKVKDAIAAGLQVGGKQTGGLSQQVGEDLEEATVLLYLRGRVAHTQAGEARLLLKDGVEISRSWLRQMLRRSPIPHQIVILDCPGAADLGEWVEDLQVNVGQCVIAAASPLTYPDTFASVLLETLTATDPQAGLPMAGWIAQIQATLVGNAIAPHIWLSGNRVIEVLPSQMGLRQDPAEFDLGICPYLGLKAFAEEDAPFFFGRESLIQQLIRAADRSFLAVVGASGSGKSSVVMAGLMAELRQGKCVPGSDEWWMGSLRPGAHPVEALIQCLAEGNTEDDRKYQQLQLEGMLYQGAEGFVHWLRSCPEPIMVLVIDQFEELFTLTSAAERQRFLDLILGGLEHASDRFKLIVTLRTDFMAPCLEYPALAEQLQGSNLLVPSVLIEADYRHVILRPAEKVGLRVQPELVEVLLQDLSHSAGDLPLLEFVLEQLWEHRALGELTLQVYQQQIGGLKGALERKAQSVYDSLDPEAQDCAQWIFLSLTQMGDGTEDTRRRVMKSDLIVPKYPVALIDRTLQALTIAKLVVVATDVADVAEQAIARSRIDPVFANLELADPDFAEIESLNPFAPKSDIAALSLPTTTIEIAHEILIRHWSTLRLWLEENRARLRSQRQIELAADQWQRSGQQPDFLLRGVRLDAAEEIYVNYMDELSQDVQQFIEAGLEERQTADRQTQRQLKRAQRTIALMGILGIAAVGLGGFAYLQRQQSLISEIKTLNALSESQLLSNRSLESLTTAVQATQQLGQLGIEENLPIIDNADVRTQTIATLQQAVEETQEKNRLEGHSQQVNSLSVSPDGRLIASGGDDTTVRLWRSDGTTVSTWQTSGRVRAVEFDPDGQIVATASIKDEVSTIALWNVADGRVKLEINISDWITSLAFSPNGMFLAAGGRDGTAKIWNVKSGQLLRTLTGHQGWVNSIAFSPDSRTLASTGEDGTVKLWNVVKSQLIRSLTGRPAPLYSVAFSPDGKTLAAAGDTALPDGNAALTLWNLANGDIASGTAQFLEGHRAPISRIVFSPDSQSLLSASSDATLRLWRISNGALVQTLKGQGGMLTAAFSPDGKTIFSGGTDKLVRSWDIRSLQLPTDSTYALSLSSTDRTLALAGWDGIIRVWNRDSLQPIKSWVGHNQIPVSALSYSPDGSLLASGSDDKIVKLWDAKTGELVRSLAGHKFRINSLSFSPTQNLLLSGSDDQTLRLWNLTDGRMIRRLSTAPDSASSIAFSPDGKTLAIGSYGNTIKLWQLDGTPLHTFTGHSLAIAAIAFSPDGRTLASASLDNTIKLWRIQDGTLLRTLTGHKNGVTSLTYSPDGNILASGGADHALKLWNPETGEFLKTLIGQSDPVLSLSFSPDGKTLFSASQATGFRHWNLNGDLLLQKGCDRLHDYLRSHPNLKKGTLNNCF